MEVGVWIVGIVLRVLNVVLAPLFWLRGRERAGLRAPPVRNTLLLHSASELAAAIRSGKVGVWIVGIVLRVLNVVLAPLFWLRGRERAGLRAPPVRNTLLLHSASELAAAIRSGKVGVWIVGIVLRVLNVVLAPLFWLRGRERAGLRAPPVRNTLLLHSASELAAAIRSGKVGVWIVGIVLRVLNVVLAPLFWLRGRERAGLRAPPVRNTLLLHSASELAAAIRSGKVGVWIVGIVLRVLNVVLAPLFWLRGRERAGLRAPPVRNTLLLHSASELAAAIRSGKVGVWIVGIVLRVLNVVLAPLFWLRGRERAGLRAPPVRNTLLLHSASELAAAIRSGKVGVWIVGIVLRVLNVVLAPLFWLRGRERAGLRAPPVRNTLLLHSASELAAAIRSGKVGVWIVGIVLRVLNVVLAPLFWLRGRERAGLRAPPVRNTLLLHSASELAAAIRSGKVGVWIVGIVLRVLNVVLAPLFWLRGRERAGLRAPPVRNTLLLHSASELAAAIRSGKVGVWIVGIVLRVLNVVLAPLFWLRGRERAGLRAPPVRNTLLLHSASELAAAIRSGKLTSEEVVTSFIARIEEVNPLLNAVVQEVFSAAVAQAREVDLMLQEARRRGELDDLMVTKPLLGVPFTVKESCSLRGLSNSVGCLEHRGRRASEDGEAVNLVRRAGAIPLLVSNTPELCLGWETTNLLHGTTNNPYCLSTTPGGSSGGEAALLACGASPLSVSSDIAGSIRIPAAYCGVFGHKPTPGVISIEGHVPTLTDENYPKFLTVGPMTRYAEDLPLLLSIMAAQEGHRLDLHTHVSVNQLRIYHMTAASRSAALLGVHPAIQSAVRRATSYLHAKCGATLCDEKFTELEESVEMSVSVFFAMKDIPNMLQDPLDPKHEKSLLLEIVKYFAGSGSRSLQALGFALLRDKLLFIPRRRLQHHRDRAARLKTIMTEKLGTDGVLVYPVHSSLAHYHHQAFLRASGVMYSMLFNVLGFPATVVPMGLHQGLPVAVQVIAAPYQDRLCLAVAKKLEQGFGGWQPIV